MASWLAILTHSSTLKQAIRNNHLTNWPLLTVENVTKHLEPFIATAKDHLDQSRKNTRSTQKQLGDNRYAVLLNELENDDDDENISDSQEVKDYFPPIIETNSEPTNYIYAAVEATPRQRQDIIHSNQTGKFHTVSYQGNLYVMLVYCYGANAILVKPIKTRAKADMVKAYQKFLAGLIRAGLKPKLQPFDNECSDILKSYLHQENINYQLVPPGMHRPKRCQRSIRTFKNHFISGLASVDSEFPLKIWDELLDQAEVSLNLLGASQMNPKLSAYAQLNGNFNYDVTHLAPPGIKVVTHDKPSNQWRLVGSTWSRRLVCPWYPRTLQMLPCVHSCAPVNSHQ